SAETTPYRSSQSSGGRVPPTIEDNRLRHRFATPAEPATRPSHEHDFGTRYEWIEDIGRGGFGSVCKADDHVLREYVAIKTIKIDDIPSGERATFLEKFKEEARNARELSHPNIVRVYSYEEGDQPFIVMALVDGGTLAQMLDERTTLDSDEASDLGIA